MIALLPFMIMAIFYVGKAMVKLVVFLFSLLAVIFSLTIKFTNWAVSLVNER